MSKVAIAGNPSGTATFTIESPATNTDRTLVLPDAAGTLDTLQRAGNVLQVVSATYSTEVIISATVYTDTGLSATITPTSATSKILVVVNQQMASDMTANTILRVDAQIVRASTSVFAQIGVNGGRAGLSGSNDVVLYGSFNGVYLDSPNTTSATTYKTQIKLNTTSNDASVNVSDSGATSSITLMEIAA